MEQDLFKYLPPGIITNILSRLPVDTIASSKCVCKLWLDLIETEFFVNCHLSNSVPFLSLAVMTLEGALGRCLVLEFEDQLDDVESDDFRFSQVTKFDIPENATIIGAANGLLLLHKFNNVLILCNPITRHYVEICGPTEGSFYPFPPPAGGGAFGFGVSRISGQYKVVRISPESECCVYTLGTGSWRRVEVSRASLLLQLEDCVLGAFLDGNLHWTVTKLMNMDKPLITCFDLETECFSSFGAPAPRGGLSVVRDCLCFCEWKDEKIVVWLMKEYGVEKSWSKEYVINFHVSGYRYNLVYPIKVFENGDLLMLWDDQFLIYYSDKTKTFEHYGIFDAWREGSVSSMPFTPSFLSLEGLGMENVISF